MPGYTMSAKIIGADEMRDVFSRSGEIFVKEFGDALYKAGIKVEGSAKQFAPVNFGQLRESIHTEGPNSTPDNVEVRVGTDVNYALAVETGSEPHMPPVMALRAWAKYKLGNENLAYAVAKTIARKGTKGQFYFKRAKEASADYLTQSLKQALDSVISILSK